MINTMFMDKMAPGILRLSVMDNDIDLFEGQYPVPDGVSYNSYLIEDEQLCLLDTVDARKQDEWLGGLNEALDGRKLDYLVISHMEPDHAGSIAALCACQPQVKLVANAKTFVMLDQFTGEHPLAPGAHHGWGGRHAGAGQPYAAFCSRADGALAGGHGRL